jgi:hypothetical protein
MSTWRSTPTDKITPQEPSPIACDSHISLFPSFIFAAALFRISERRRRKYKQMVEDAQKDAATDASSTNTVSSSNTNTAAAATAAVAAEGGGVDPFPCLLGSDGAVPSPSTTMRSAGKVKPTPKSISTRAVGDLSPANESATGRLRSRRPRRWNRHLSRGEGAAEDKSRAASAAVVKKGSSSTTTTPAHGGNRMPGITWDETWFVRGGDGGGGSGGFDAVEDKEIRSAKPRTLASARTNSILGRVEPREYDDREVDDVKRRQIDDGDSAAKGEHGALEQSAASGSASRHRWFCDGGTVPDSPAADKKKKAAPPRDRAAAAMQWEDGIGAILSGGSWIDVTSTVASKGGIGEGENEAPETNPTSSAGVLVEEHSRNHDEEQIEVYYEAAASETNIIGAVAHPAAMDSNKTPIDSAAPTASPARLMRQVDRITGDLVEIQIDNSERCSPLRCVSHKVQRSPTSVRDPLTGDWVEIQPHVVDDAAHNVPGREPSAVTDRSDECESIGGSRSSSSSSAHSSSLSSSRSGHDGGVDESWSTVHEEGDRAEEDCEDLHNLSGYSDDTLVQDHASTSPEGIAACGFGEGFCVTAASASAEIDEASEVIVEDAESPQADSSTQQIVKRDPAGFTVAEFLSLESSHANDPKADRLDESACPEDDCTSSDEEDDSFDDDDDDIVRDDDEETKDQLLHGKSPNEDIMSQYLCCGQDQAMLMEDSYDVDDEYEGDSLAESN